MKLVIEIPEEIYKNAKAGLLCGNKVIVDAIANGTPLPKGHWISNSPTTWECSNCNYIVMKYNNTNFCPNCGADMRDKEREE